MTIIQQFYILVQLSLLYSFQSSVKSNSILYVVPTGPSNTSSNGCPIGYGVCYNLNEWVENGTSPFMNGTTVMLLPGAHTINSTKKKL